MTEIPQPTLLPEGPYSNLERVFQEEQPENWWPENQNSNFGQFRKVLTDILQGGANTIDELFTEMFIETAIHYIGIWEDELGVPRGTIWPDEHRKTTLRSRRQIAPFTRTRREELVIRFILDTFGVSVAITPDGIPLTAGGVPLYADTTDVSLTYRITENITNFSYLIEIRDNVTPDMAGLGRELDHITPAGISYTIDNTWDGT